MGIAPFSSTKRSFPIFRLPIIKIPSPAHDVTARMSVTGNMPCASKIPMLAEARPETPICRKPSMAEALPIFRSNGDNAKAVWRNASELPMTA